MELIENIRTLHPLQIAGILIALTGLIILIFNLRALFIANSSKNWPSTTGEILSSDLDITKSISESDKLYNPKIEYRYVINNKEYISQRIYFGSSTSSSFKKAKSIRIVEKYTKGQKVKVFYNPMNSSESILERGVKSEVISLLVASLVLLVGSYYLLTYFELILKHLEK